MTIKLKDSGKRRQFQGGAVRDRGTLKGRPDLLPIFPLFRFSLHMEKGAVKYAARNWEKGMPLSEFYNSAMRHLWKAIAGFTDEDHWDAALWNIACLMEGRERIKRGLWPKKFDDIPKTYAGLEPGF